MNVYLEKIALRRIVSELAKGTVSTPLKTLADKGFIKPISTYAKGMNEGNKAMAKKIGVNITKAKGPLGEVASGGGGYAMVEDRRGLLNVIHKGKKADLHPIFSNKHNLPVHHPALVRHEIFEAQDFLKKKSLGTLRYVDRVDALKHTRSSIGRSGMPEGDAKAYLSAYVKGLRHTKPVTPASIVNEVMQPVGGHVTPRVLTQESEMVRKNPYLKEFKKLRSFTGERSLLERLTGKRYGIDKMTSSNHSAAFKAKPDNVVQAGKNHVPVFYAYK